MQFTKEQFLNVFVQYNNSVFPAQIVLFLLAVLALYFVSGNSKIKDKAAVMILAFLWLWIGIVYHYIFFTKINNAAYMFAVFFVIQSILFFITGVTGNKLKFEIKKNVYFVIGAVIVLYGLIIYPVLGYILGHVYPASPTFGLPCPTVIFTFGILLMAAKKVPKYLLIIPGLWALLGFTAAFLFGIYEDLGLIASALIGITAILLKDRKAPVSVLSKA